MWALFIKHSLTRALRKRKCPLVGTTSNNVRDCPSPSRFGQFAGNVAVYLSDVNMSEVEARRNYENLIAQMGGMKVNSATPSELAPPLSAENSANEQKTRFADLGMTYDVYLVRKTDQLVSIVLMSGRSAVSTLVVAEQPFKQTIAFVTADAM